MHQAHTLHNYRIYFCILYVTFKYMFPLCSVEWLMRDISFIFCFFLSFIFGWFFRCLWFIFSKFLTANDDHNILESFHCITVQFIHSWPMEPNIAKMPAKFMIFSLSSVLAPFSNTFPITRISYCFSEPKNGGLSHHRYASQFNDPMQ